MTVGDLRYVSRVFLALFIGSSTLAFGAALWLAIASINPMHDPTYWVPHVVEYHRV